MRRKIRGISDMIRFSLGLASTQFFVGIAWLFFRAKDMGQAWYFLGQIVHWRGSDLTGRFTLIVLVFCAAVLILDVIEYKMKSEVYLLRLRPAVAAAICTAVFIVAFLYMATNKPMPFVYFQF
jgi:hypothetical protein